MTYNEPNLRRENTPEKIVANKYPHGRVHQADRSGSQNRRVCVLSGINNAAIERMLNMIKAQGKLGLFKWAVYHGYSANPDRLQGTWKN
jgi:hypothetical protein